MPQLPWHFYMQSTVARNVIYITPNKQCNVKNIHWLKVKNFKIMMVQNQHIIQINKYIFKLTADYLSYN